MNNCDNYKKTDFGIEVFNAAYGPGLVNVEGDEWKAMRKRYSAIFHFSLIKNNTIFLAKLAEQTLENIGGGTRVILKKYFEEIITKNGILLFVGPNAIDKTV